MSAISVASKVSDSSSSSPTTSSSSSDLSPDQQRDASTLQKNSNSKPKSNAQTAAQTNESSSERLRPVASFEELEAPPTSSPTQALPRVTRAQSARMRASQCFADVPMAGVKGLKSAVAKQMQSISVRSRSIPYFNEASTAPHSYKKTANSERSRPVSYSDDSFLEDSAKKTAPSSVNRKTKKLASDQSPPTMWFDEDEEANLKAKAETEKKRAETAKSLRSRPVPCFDGGPGLQQKEKGWKPRAVRTRPASGPTSYGAPPKSTNGQVSSASDDTQLSARRQNSNPSAPKPTRQKSATKLASATPTPTNQNRSCRRFPSEEKFSVNRLRASSDSGPGLQQPHQLSEENFRPRASSDSSSVERKIKSSRLRHYEGKFQNRRGQSLLYFSLFPPEKLAMRGIILHLHGIGDHCRRNTALYERYCDEGFGVISYDLINHGASEFDKNGVRAHINNFNELVDDTNDFITFAKTNIYKVALRYWRKHHHPFHPHGKERKRKSLPELPLIITGNSVGSLIGLHTVLSGKQKFHAAVWASPSLGVTWTPVLWAQWKFSKALLATFPTTKMIPAVQYNLRSRNSQFLIKYQKDPLTCCDMITPRTGCQIVHAMNRLHKDKRVPDAGTPFCSIPMLFLAGADDRVSDQQTAFKFFSRMGSFDKEFKFFEGLYHMIFDEPEQEDVFKYLINWLHKRFPLETRNQDGSHKNLTEKLEPSTRQQKFIQAELTDL